MDASIFVIAIVNQHDGVEIVRTAEDVEGCRKRCAQNATVALQTRGQCPAHLIKTFIALTQPLYSPLTALWLAVSSSVRSMSFVLPVVISIAIFTEESVIYRAAGEQEPITKIAIKNPPLTSSFYISCSPIGWFHGCFTIGRFCCTHREKAERAPSTEVSERTPYKTSG